MKTITNRFGTGVLYEKKDLGDSIYAVCTACMSVWSDFLSFSNFMDSLSENRVNSKFNENDTDNYKATDTIVVLGCQVTDLAIYNDLQTAKELHEKYPNIPIYMGGCLAQRFDIALPDWLKRLDVVRVIGQEIIDRNSVEYKAPFWNKNLKPTDDELTEGNLFRNMYPLKIGAGCHGKCKYCTIRDTRGETYCTDAYLQIQEFLNHADEEVVLISDSPTPQQIKDWCHIAKRYNKPISFRNIEPQNANICKEELLDLADKKLLKIFHCPIQSNDEKVLKAMNRSVSETFKYIELAQLLRHKGVVVATNIIIDYIINEEIVKNMPTEWLNSHFDYWSWNPYFDGKWDEEKAKERFEKYIK